VFPVGKGVALFLYGSAPSG